MRLALYHPEAGYYSRPRPRVGRQADRDFFTASSLGPLFGELVAVAAVKLLDGQDPREFTFVEIGAEAEPADSSCRLVAPGILAGLSHPFAESLTISLGQPIQIPEKSVVFSNELFDAQPCHRLVRRQGSWRELGVAWREGRLVETELAAFSPGIANVTLPTDAPEGYHLDLPCESVGLMREITTQAWRGLFVAFDYGKSWQQLASETPQGTVRAYSRHRQTTDLLGQPGEQDLTCHVCWDWLAATLTDGGFSPPVLESQEAFFTHHAAGVLQSTIEAGAGRFSAQKQALLQLLHPAQMGQKFQVLHALRK